MTRKKHIDYIQFFKLAENHYGVRGHEKKLTKDRSRLDTRKYFFSQRSTVGTVFQQKLSMPSPSSISRTPTTAHPAKIWTTEADQLPSPSTYKYK